MASYSSLFETALSSIIDELLSDSGDVTDSQPIFRLLELLEEDKDRLENTNPKSCLELDAALSELIDSTLYEYQYRFGHHLCPADILAKTPSSGRLEVLRSNYSAD